MGIALVADAGTFAQGVAVETGHRMDAGATGAGDPETPFTGLWTAAPPQQEGTPPLTVESPFLSQYRSGDELVDHEAEAAGELMAELSDPELDEALEDLIAEAEAEIARFGVEESPAAAARAARVLGRWVEPLAIESEAILEGLADALRTRDAGSVREDELMELAQRFEPRGTDLGPVFEDFLRKIFRKATRVVKGAARLAKRGITAAARVLPIGQILRRLKGLVRPLLDRVLNVALDRLPPDLRPYAARLAQRFIKKPSWPFPETEGAPASVDVRDLQSGFDAEIAALLLAPGEIEQEEVVAEAAAMARPGDADPLGELHEARESFITALERLEPGQDPTPLVEEFVPALLPVLRLGIKLGGRSRVVRYLAKYIGRLIAPYAGPQVTPALSQAIVDAGLRLLTLEEPEEAEEPAPRLAAEAFAGLVEDTVRRVCTLPEEELADEQALEEAAYEAFQEAVAANFPPAILDPASEYLETSRPYGMWLAMPRGRRACYRKFSHVFPVRVTPQVARSIRTFGGRTLGRFLRDSLGRTGVVQGHLHLYQAVPGTRLSRLGSAERMTGGGRMARTQLHPLTPQAAGVLLGEPGLGREVDPVRIDRGDPPQVGERLFYLEVPGARPLERRSSDAAVVVDTGAGEIRLSVFLGESDAQEIARRLRRREPLGAALAALRRITRAELRSAFAEAGRRVRVIGTAGTPAPHAGASDPALRRLVADGIGTWLMWSIRRELPRQRDAFVEAAAAEADGVTIAARVVGPPGLDVLAGAAADRSSGVTRASDGLSQIFRHGPEVMVGFHPGRDHVR
ncbi:hypothetical protein [Microbispora triticiradicis]|uniref:Uncharacterized protein n=2 Tax=Microbispora TaxID=2005 RepID=A0ABY3LUJ8_9ACTN|nr:MULTISPECIES: hypothetical protein [Microbispora]TLP52411.1 hypothetical protein FED44_32405 [Microbispora fusca]TYB55423.1 hypothetical protein FXF59_21205 [Microbispora tritici]